MPIFEYDQQHFGDELSEGPGGGGGSNSSGYYYHNGPKQKFYYTDRSEISFGLCDALADNSGWAQRPFAQYPVSSYLDVSPGVMVFEGDFGWLADGFYGISQTRNGDITHIIRVGVGNSNSRVIQSRTSCTLVIIPDPDPVIEDPTPVNPPVTPPGSNIEYCYYTILNDSYSKKIFGYYSGSADFKYQINKTTGSGASGPDAGFIRLDSGSLGSGGTTDEVDSKFLYIDVKDSGSQEDIVSYLTQLETLNPSHKGRVRLEVENSSSYYLDFNVNSITTQSISSDGWFEIGLTNGQSYPNDNPFSSSLSVATMPTESLRNMNVRFFNDALLGYNEVELNGSGSVSFIAAMAQTSSALPSGSIPEPFNTSWGVSEKEFLKSNYYPSSQGNAWMWNDGYKVKHVKVNNRSYGGDILSNFIKKSEDSNFVLFNPKNSNDALLYSGSGNYSEEFILSNVTKYPEYNHLLIDQLNPDTSFAVKSDNFAQTDFNLSVDGRYVIYATSSGTITHPTASTGISKSIPQGYFPATLDTEQYFRGWDNANYYSNGNLISTQGDINDPLLGFNSGSTERDKDDSVVYVPSTLPFFINQTSSYVTIQSESILQYTEGLTNLTQIGPTFQVVAGGQQKYFLKETTGEVYISGSENIDLKKTGNPLFNTLYDIEVVPMSNNTTYYDTGEGFDIEVGPSQSLWLSRGISNPGTLDGDIWKYNRFLHRPYKAYALTTTGSYIKGYSEELYGDIIYREGAYPVGPPPNEFETIYIAYSESAANLRDDGIYTFPTQLTENITIYADVELDYLRNSALTRAKYGEAEFGSEEYGQEDSDPIYTWQTAALKLYKNNNLLSSQTLNNVPSLILGGANIEITKSISAGGMNAGDTLKLSLEVSNAQANFNAALIVPQYNLRIGAPVPPTSDLVPVTFANSLGRTDDCHPTLNNVSTDRPNPRLQDIDYSIDINSPVNFNQIIKDEAVRATVPESNYTQQGFSTQRYSGVKSNTEKYNVFTIGDTGTYGKISNIDIEKAYFAYFDQIYDMYPLIEGKTTLNIKYLFDSQGNRFNPRLGTFNYFNLEGTFNPGSTLTLSNNIKEDDTLSLLNTSHTVLRVGEKPTPILYTQTGGQEYTSSINFTGFQPPAPEPPTYNDYSFIATGLILPSENTEFGGASLSSKGTMTTLSPNDSVSGSNTNVTQSYFPGTGIIDLPITDHHAPNGVGSGKVLSDVYTLNIEHSFDTSPIQRNRDDDGSGVFQSEQWTSGKVGAYYFYPTVNGSSARLKNIDVILDVVYVNANNSNGIESKTFSYKNAFPNNVNYNNTVLSIDIHSANIQTYMNQQGWPTGKSGENNTNPSGNNGNFSGTWLKLKWTIKAKVQKDGGSGFFNTSGTGFKQGDKIKAMTSGFFKQRDGGGAWQNYFFPTFENPSTYTASQTDKYVFSNTKNLPPAGALAPYWAFATSGGNNVSDTLEMQSEKVNEAYDNELKQIDLAYTASSFPTFPLNIEPDFVQFPPITQFWSLKIRDEIKFENNESLVYQVKSIIPPAGNSGKLKVVVTPPIENQTINLDFFSIRRFIEEKGTIILDTKKPYSFPISASSSPGLILPEFPIIEIGTDPDLIIKDLEDKKLID